MVAYNPDLCYEPQSTIGHYYIEELKSHRKCWFSHSKMPPVWLLQGFLILVMNGWDWEHSQ